MYWPVGAPRIYAAKVPPPSGNFDYDSEDSGELVRNSLSLSSSGGDGEPPEPGCSTRGSDEDEDESKKVGEQQVEDEESIADESQSGKENDDDDDTNDVPVNSEELRTHIVALEVARSGALFATVTAAELTIWQTKPTAVVAHVRRSPRSIEGYGPNVNILIRPDSQIFVVQTSQGYLMTYSLTTDPNARVYKPQFVQSNRGHTRQPSLSGIKIAVGANGLPLGAGEAGGIWEFSLQFGKVIQINAGISRVLALENELMVATIKPPAIQCIRWTPDSTGNLTSAELLSRMSWMQKKVITTDMVYDRPMNLSTWVTSDGRAYAVQRVIRTENEGPKSFKGYCFHIPSDVDQYAVRVSINARFSLIAVGCANGSISVYSARDYNGNVPLSHKLSRPSSSPGKVTFVTWSSDGYCLVVGYTKGWATWSVYGQPGGNSFHGNPSSMQNKPNEQYLGGVKGGAWIANGGEMLLLNWRGDERIWNLEFAKSAITECFSSVSTSRPMLHSGQKLLIYRGYDQDDITMISQDTSVLWHTVQMPAMYLAENWPIRSMVSSADGRYVAIAGTRGLAHYSVNSGRWKMFVDQQMEHEFVVRGGMCWYQHILIAAVESGDNWELRLFSRELKLDNNLILFIESLSSAVVFMDLTGDNSLLVYTHDNTLYHFIIQGAEDSVKLVQVGRIGFHGIIHAPTRVRSISWIVPDDQLRGGDPSRDVATASVIFLLDGKLVLLQPSYSEEGGLKYDMRVILQNVEYYSLTRDQPPENLTPLKIDQFQHALFDGHFSEILPAEASALSDSLWAFDGKVMKVWMDINQVLKAILDGKDLPAPVIMTIDFYPIAALLRKGLVLGIESELIQRRDISVSYFKFSTRTHLFLTYLLRHLLTTHQPEAAVLLAHRYESLAYFPHALEVLLHDVLDDEADSPPEPADAILPEVVGFLTHFPHYLDVIVGCTRKTEVASWRHLFSVVGSPQTLFEESLARGLLKTAGGYLLVLHTLEQLSESSQDMVRLFSRAVAEGDWDLCQELARFLTALDNSGKTLREALELVQLRSPVNEEQRSFMFSGKDVAKAEGYGFPDLG